MAIPILVITPSAGFGELISQVMEETGSYAIALANNAKDAQAFTKKHKPAVCILDADLEDMPLNELVAVMRETVPDLLVILIPPDEASDDILLDDIRADGYLSKPFYLPDLLVTVEETVKQSGVKDVNRVSTAPLSRSAPVVVEEEETNTAPDWLQDVSLAAQHLTRLSLESSSQASLVTRADQIWAYAGELPQPAAQELAGTVARYFADGGGSDLARFIHLEATGGEYMLYATGLASDFVLALVFDAEMPFSKMRSQANKLAHALTSEPAEVDLVDEEVDQLSENEVDPAPPDLSVLSDVPPPIPNDWMPADTPSEERKGFLEELLEDDVAQPISAGKNLELETSPAQQVVEMNYEQEVDVAVVEEQNLDEGLTQVSGTGYEDETVVSDMETAAVDIDATVLSKTSHEDKDLKLEPVSPSVYNLTYACVLIPRMPEHHLTGDLAGQVSELVTQLCLAFGWRLEKLSIRPDYLQWMVNVPPSTSPGYLMRIIRQHTARRLFAEIPRLVEDNPSGDFWAPGYLIMSGSDLPPAKLVRDFIKDTRRRQGISK
jgi:DNA-binding response OmpR family regulator/REP element-mobilizing transposase RayT